MAYTTFSTNKNDQLLEPMFFGQSVNVARYDQQKHKVFEDLIEKQLSFFWRPEEVDVTKDRIDFNQLPDNERHIFISNLKYQTLLDSVLGRSPNITYLPIVSLPELETWIETWTFSETIHSRSYTHIIRGIVSDPSVIFEDIVDNVEIVKRTKQVTKYFDQLIRDTMLYTLYGEGTYQVEGEEVTVSLSGLKRLLYLCTVSVNVTEAVRFYVSFACSFAFAERKLMEGNAKIIKLISRDEQLHLLGTQNMIKIWKEGIDDPEMKAIAEELEPEAIEIFKSAAEQEKEWAEYLFKDGSMLGLNTSELHQYIEYITNLRMKEIGLPMIYETRVNPFPWINNWIVSDNVQVAPQETEITSYLTNQVDSTITTDDFSIDDL